jgi:hypothetical protein
MPSYLSHNLHYSEDHGVLIIIAIMVGMLFVQVQHHRQQQQTGEDQANHVTVNHDKGRDRQREQRDYMLLTYMPSYLSHNLHYSEDHGVLIIIAIMVGMAADRRRSGQSRYC